MRIKFSSEVILGHSENSLIDVTCEVVRSASERGILGITRVEKHNGPEIWM